MSLKKQRENQDRTFFMEQSDVGQNRLDVEVKNFIRPHQQTIFACEC